MKTKMAGKGGIFVTKEEVMTNPFDEIQATNSSEKKVSRYGLIKRMRELGKAKRELRDKFIQERNSIISEIKEIKEKLTKPKVSE